jgi:colanic acid/amylovoran biosynthesis glycosyltransferase
MPGPRVAYLLLWFPEPSQTFVLDEVNTLVRLGLDVRVYTLYGPRPATAITGMATVLAPMHHLGTAALPRLVRDLLRLGRTWGPGAAPFLRRVGLRRWRSLETGGEALWAGLAGVHLAGIMTADGIDHIHAPWANGPATAAWVASTLSGIPFSFSGRAHDIYPPDGALWEKLTAAALVRTENRSNLRYLAALYPQAAGKLVNIYPGVPMEKAQVQAIPAPPPYRLLAVGRFVRKKGFPLLLEACRLLAAQEVDFQLTLAGGGPEGPQIAELVKEYNLTDRVTLPGFLPHRQIQSLLQKTHLFVMPSLIAPSGDRDGIPTVILEALLHEVPVVATEVSGIPEVVVPGVTGWLTPPGDPQALARDILAALSDPTEASRRAEAGCALVARDFDSRKNYAHLKALIEGACGSPPSEAGIFPDGHETPRRGSAAALPGGEKRPKMPGPRVAYLLLWFPEPSQTFVLDEVNTLVRLGLDARVYTLYGPRPASAIAGMAEVLAPVHHLGTAALPRLVRDLLRLGRSRGPGAAPFLRRVMVRRWRSPETGGEALWACLTGVHLAGLLTADGIDHIHAPWANGPATAAWVASTLSGIPFSFSGRAHDIYPPDGALQEKMAAAQFIRTNTRINQQYLGDLCPHLAGKVVNVYNGVSLTPAAGPRPLARRPFHLLALGRLVPKKGFTVLMEACRRLAAQGLDIRLTLAGDGPERGKIRELIHREGLAQRVNLPGAVPHREVARLMAAADLLVMPSLITPWGDRDGIPNVILEALLCAVPVVASAVSGIPEVIREGDTGWLTAPGDPEALARAVVAALADPEEARRRAGRGRDLVAREFDSRKNYARLKARFEVAARPHQEL